jgi:hypothetical protein
MEEAREREQPLPQQPAAEDRAGDAGELTAEELQRIAGGATSDIETVVQGVMSQTYLDTQSDLRSALDGMTALNPQKTSIRTSSLP